MSTYFTLVRGVMRQATLPGAFSAIYDKSISIVASGGSAPGSLNAPVAAATAITLPGSGTYTLDVNSIPNMNIFFNGQRLEYGVDWNTSGSGPNYTAFTLNFGLVATDRLDLRTERS